MPLIFRLILYSLFFRTLFITLTGDDREVERLVVTIEGDFSKLLEDTDKAVDQASKQLESIPPAKLKVDDKEMSFAAKSAETLGKGVDFLRERFGLLSLAWRLGGRRLIEFGKSSQIAGGAISNLSGGIGKAATSLFRFSRVPSLISGITVAVTGLTAAVVAAGVAVVAAFGIGAVLGIKNFIKNVKEATAELREMVDLQTLQTEGVATNVAFEGFEASLTTLLGSADAAQERIEELIDFASETPFQLPGVIQASTILQNFGGEFLATGKNLQLVGDLASASRRPFEEVAVTVGRLFSAIQSGRPFGEAAARMQELGLLSGEARAELEEMQKEGASSAEVWAKFEESMSGFTGQMELQSMTLGGLRSNLEDFRSEVGRAGGEAIFEEEKRNLEGFLAFLNENEKAIKGIAQAIGLIRSAFTRWANEFKQAILDNIPLDRIRDILRVIVEIADNLRITREVSGLLSVPEAFGKGFKTVLDIAEAIAIAIAEISNRIALATGILRGLIRAVEVFTQQVEQSLGSLATGDLRADLLLFFTTASGEAKEMAKDSAFAALNEEIENTKTLIDEADQRRQDYFDGLDFGGGGGGDDEDPVFPGADTGPAEEEANKAKEILGQLATEIADLQAETQMERERLNEEHQERMAEIEEEGAERRMEIEEDFQKAIQKLETDSEKRRRDAFTKANEALAKLRTETDEKLAESKDTFNREERRRTEDHLREMRRLEDDFLRDLSDAVRDRDARAVLDLQRRFSEQTSQRSEDFETGESRREEDQSQELADLREHENQRRQEIADSLAKELATIIANEEEKRVQLEEKRAEDLMNLQESLAEQRQAEIESFDERSEALDMALQRRLEAITKELADQDEITKEGAEDILSTLNEYFGIGGEVDELMKEFENRRKLKMEIEVNFDTNASKARQESFNEQNYFPENPRRRGLPVTPFAEGGSMIATKPTLALFGEKTPEFAQFTPLSKLGQQDMSFGGSQRLEIEFSGSAPPGIRSNERDQIAATLLDFLRQSGALEK